MKNLTIPASFEFLHLYFRVWLWLMIYGFGEKKAQIAGSTYPSATQSRTVSGSHKSYNFAKPTILARVSQASCRNLSSTCPVLILGR